MEQPIETTSFRGDDDPRLVRAALACRRCLSAEVEWMLDLREWEAQVECVCRKCGQRSVVALDSQQALRLSLHRMQPLAA